MIPQHVAQFFKKVDPILFNAISLLKSPVYITPKTDYFSALCESIISQQISTKAGDAIWNRFKSLFPQEEVSANFAISIQPDILRSIGISSSKARYIQDLATKVTTEEIQLNTLISKSDDEIMKELTKVKGIGPWTVEMFLMFTLGREDIFSTKDLGLKRGIQKLYKISHEPTATELEKISRIWSPYRTYASLLLWRSLSTK